MIRLKKKQEEAERKEKEAELIEAMDEDSGSGGKADVHESASKGFADPFCSSVYPNEVYHIYMQNMFKTVYFKLKMKKRNETNKKQTKPLAHAIASCKTNDYDIDPVTLPASRRSPAMTR